MNEKQNSVELKPTQTSVREQSRKFLSTGSLSMPKSGLAVDPLPEGLHGIPCNGVPAFFDGFGEIFIIS